MIPALLGKPPKRFNQQDESRVNSLSFMRGRLARGRSERLVSVRQTFAISGQPLIDGIICPACRPVFARHGGPAQHRRGQCLRGRCCRSLSRT